jgi:hypothetical protein
MSKAADERPECIALKEETDIWISEFKNLTTHIIKATKIESKTSSVQIKEKSFIKSIQVAAQGFILGDDTTCNLDWDSIFSTIMECHSAHLLCHLIFASVESSFSHLS